MGIIFTLVIAIIGALVGFGIYYSVLISQQNAEYEKYCYKAREVPAELWLRNQVTIHEKLMDGYWVCRN